MRYLQLTVKVVLNRSSVYFAAEILVDHRNGTVDQIAEGVGKFGVVFGDEHFIGDVAILGIGHCGQQIITDCVDAEQVDHIVGIDDISFGFAHLVGGEQQPRMTKYLFGERKVHAHQEDRPVDGVETEDILADDVQVSRPQLFKLLGLVLGVITNRSDIVVQCVQPDVDDMTGVEIDRNTPFKEVRETHRS